MDVNVKIKVKKPKPKKQSKKFTNLIIIDASGSMASKWLEVVGGIKKVFKDIKEDAVKNPKVESTTIVMDFASARDYKVLVNSKNPEDLNDSIAEAYSTRGWTALFDAIGYGFSLIPPDQDGVFVNILTDGEENDSKEMKSSDIKKLIADGKAKKWAITFMGTSDECLNTAVDLGISRGNTMQFTNSSAGVGKAMNTSTLSRAAYYTSTVSVDAVNFADLEVDNLVSTVKSDED